ncbi:MAG: hypothetical protein IM473_21515 [Microcystis sp. M015S2]|uniref:hypothetical protein n=1 Tax=unclassified Microcystis TaxID=2643300 RepID=UPI0025857BE0|nr:MULTISPECIES: hypothetical protein [unclassified Microcystis]MCA2656539.1 hypothetical protein [Microcystis sp. M061S2]MCA2710453.1 hypothetical protein [Microcystis sp. M025S2]MCA2744882.1 hypothetical protein [Microcystis sp. M015S2]MCA2761178.1 hypothetical protein [Microcystis sp. M145S2]
MKTAISSLPEETVNLTELIKEIIKILDNQGERIWVESQAGEGATFYFTWHKNTPS